MNQETNTIMLYLMEIEMYVDNNRPKSDAELFELVKQKAVELEIPDYLAEAFVKFYCQGLTKGLAIANLQFVEGEP